jgi:hypothetical protein
MPLKLAPIITTIVILFCLNNLKAQSVPLTLQNSSPNHILIEIPNVYSSKLAPRSNISVNLKYGQKVFYIENESIKNKELLFTVNQSWTKDTILLVDKIIENKKNKVFLNNNHKH